MPEPTASEIAKDAEQEAGVFSQAANVDRLLTMLKSLDAAKENIADDEEIQVRISCSVDEHEFNSLVGTLSVLHDLAAQNSQTNR